MYFISKPYSPSLVALALKSVKSAELKLPVVFIATPLVWDKFIVPDVVNPDKVPTDVMFVWAAPVTVAAVPLTLPVTLPVMFPTKVPLILLLASSTTAFSAGRW